MSIRPKAKVSEVSEEEKEITSKDLTKKQFLLYIFNDFLRGFYLIGCLFLDGLVILQLYSFIPSKDLRMGPFSNSIFREIVLFAATIILEILAIYIEAKGYRRIWPKGSMFIGHKPDKETT